MKQVFGFSSELGAGSGQWTHFAPDRGFPVAACFVSCAIRGTVLDCTPVKEHHRTLLAAQGYSELKMFDDALAELAQLPEEARLDPGAMEMKVVILTQAQRWEDALASSLELCRLAPAEPGGFIHAAFCLHGLGRSAEAKETLLNGPPSLEKEPTYHYNLACYECVLGNHREAREYLERSIAMDKKFREFARTDPDLLALHR